MASSRSPATPRPAAPATVEGASLSVEGLTVVMAKSRIPVVTDVSFDVAAGTVMGLVGESGSGKSTVGLALLGHVRRGLAIAGGSVRLGDQDILQLRDGALRRARGRLVAYVPQDPASGLNPAMRLGAQLREAISIHADVLEPGETVEDRAATLLEEVDLPATKAFQRSYPHQTSGGQQQRIGIAMAFACRPRLVVLDEPTTGLDVTTQRRVLETVRRLAGHHRTTAVYVSHDLPVVAEIADATAVMYAGRLVEYAPSDRLFAVPRHPYTGGLLNAAPTPDRSTVLVGIEGQPPRPGRWPAGCKFADRCPRSQPDCLPDEPPLAPVDGGALVRCRHPLEDGGGTRAEPVAAVANARTRGRGSLEVHGLTAHYGQREILHDVDLSIPAGRCLAVVGESGSGKTTLARCLVGLHGDWTGDARVDGEPIAAPAHKRTSEQRRLVQYIFQNPHASLNPRMSVGENVEEPLRHFERLDWRARRAKVLDALELVALGRDFADRMPGQLSGGERQRVAVARALIVEPELVICDEITSALDVSVQALLVEQLRHLQHDRGLTALFITHNLSVVRSIAQDVMVLEQGTVVERGTAADVLERPQHPYTQQLVADLPRFAVR
jgi:peptide/nickel transport system ATP-binding protein